MNTLKTQYKTIDEFIATFPAEIQEVSQYRTGKGTLQFPLDKPIPLELIRKIVGIRIEKIGNKKAKK